MDISIVIPVYHPNKEYLVALFRSITLQTYQDFELVISDDGNSEELIKSTIPDELQRKTSYFNNTGRKGIFGNLNNGLHYAQGDNIQIFCQDDIMLPTLLEANRSRLTDDVSMVFSHFDAISTDGRIATIHHDAIKFIPNTITSQEANNYFLYFGCLPGNLSPVMIRKSLLAKTGYFNENFQFVGDFEFWIRAARHTNLYFLKESHLLVRRHDESAGSTLGTLRRFFELKEVLTSLLANNTMPFDQHILHRYIHIHVFRTVVINTVLKVITLRRVDFNLLRQIFDGKPFSLHLAWLSFLSPIPKGCRPLQQFMEVRRP